jgi:hypothetical protein
MIKTIITIFLCLVFTSYSQQTADQKLILYNNSANSDMGNTLILGSILAVTPTLVLEDSKAYFGISKELSAGRFPYGRAELDYTFIFRSERQNALHFSYNFDIPLNGNFSDPSLFMISPGGGYYTDFTRKGFFAQIAFGLFASTGFSNDISIHPNIKFRKVFMQNNHPGIIEVSLGVGFGFYSR